MISLLFSLLAFAGIPEHCTPWPPDGTLYVDGVKYDNEKPKECYSVMFNGEPVLPELLKMEDGKLIIDKEKMDLLNRKILLERSKKAQDIEIQRKVRDGLADANEKEDFLRKLAGAE